MGRFITEFRKEQIKEARVENPQAIGPMLGELVIAGNVPIEAVALLLNVSEPTVYRWMYGFMATRNSDRALKITALIMVLRKAKRARDLPLDGTIKERVARMMKVALEHKAAL